MTRTWGGVAAAVAICVLVGCGKGDGPALAPATGVVTLDGKPLENARVMFHPKEKAARYSYASTDASGRFQMSTFGMNDGALVGRILSRSRKSTCPKRQPRSMSRL